MRLRYPKAVSLLVARPCFTPQIKISTRQD
jgi:hypothetical protein